MKKYLDDYRVEYQLTPGGKLKGVPVYTGPRFRPVLEQPQLKRLKTELIILTALSAVLLFLLLLFSTVLKDAFSLLGIPIGFSLIPLLLIGRAVWLLCTSKMPTTRERKDKISLHFPAAAAFFMVLSGIGAVGMIAQLAVKGPAIGDLLYTLAACALTACAVLLFLRRNGLAMERVEKA